MQDIQLIHGKRIYFGHQSVGANILEGLREIVPANAPAPALQDTFIGKNGDPEGKCDDFVRQFEQAANTPFDFALMKFCYVDFDVSTDPAALFARYSATLDSLKAKYRDTTFIPITAPLTTRPPAWKRTVKGILGGADIASDVNAKRAAFNRLLIEHYNGQPVFDLARVESTYADGSRNQFEYKGQTAYSLIDAYTDDGGHLNATGRKLAAAELLHTLAGATRARSARVSPF